MCVPALGRTYSSASTAIQRRRPLPQATATTRRKHGFPPAMAYLGAMEPVLERLYGRGEVTM